MNPDIKIAGILCGVAMAVFMAPAARAVEGAMGRPISGSQIMPYAGIVPPAPGFAASVGEIYYDGSIGGSTTTSVGDSLAVDLKMKMSFTPISLLYVWNTSTNINWNFASGVTLPVTWLQVDADVASGPKVGHVADNNFGLFDLAFVPLSASYHISPTDHVALSLTVWAPTGSYDKNRLANLSMNTWSFVPSVAYTKIFPEPNIELTGMWALTFDTENTATDYQNGILSDLEATAIKRFKCGAGAGVVGSWIQQLSGDSGATADLLDGFYGRALGVGPIFTYSTKLGTYGLDFNVRWVHEFENKNYVQGDVFMANAIFTF